MSHFSGKCDLADHMMGMGGWFSKDGNPIKFGEGTGPYYSDEMLDFIEFKKQTGGVIHQHKKILVTEWNQEDVKQHCPGFDFIEKAKEIPDKRCKNGVRVEKTFIYTYYGKIYETLRELNKKGVYVTIDIHFDTLLDLIPYYPYIVTSAAHSDGKATIYISDLPYPIETRNDGLKRGNKIYNHWEHYAKELQEHYREIVLRYFNPEGYECIEELTFENNQRWAYNDFQRTEKYIACTSQKVDENFPIEWVIEKEDKTHWTSPKIIYNWCNGTFIEMSKEDAEHFLGTKIKVRYVKARKHEINLW